MDDGVKLQQFKMFQDTVNLDVLVQIPSKNQKTEQLHEVRLLYINAYSLFTTLDELQLIIKQKSLGVKENNKQLVLIPGYTHFQCYTPDQKRWPSVNIY